MKRRVFIPLVGGVAAAWTLTAPAQSAERSRRISVLLGWAPGVPQARPFLAAFETALQKLGWTEGRNIRIDYHWAGTDTNQIQAIAHQLGILKPDLIIAHSTPVAAALQRETNNIPVVFVTVSDPVGSGFVASLARPGGNMTGLINIESSLRGKWVEILKDVAPRTTRAGLIFNPETAPHFNYYLHPFEAAARSFGIEPVTATVRNSDDIERLVMSLPSGDSGLAVMPDIFTAEKRNHDLIISLVARRRVPTVYPYAYMTAAGGLISYGIDNRDLWQRAATYVDTILKGSKPSDLPVQLPTKFELAINLNTAKALGIEVPPTLLARADEVIE